ncbi:MAG: hypothetical protein LBB92_00185 [Endomicrobium sp.]|jgi:hypothetical protein|nr:hypothetical protein [Endomicrobium sp.]
MKKFVLLAAFIAMVGLSLSACGSGKDKAEAPNEPNVEQQEEASSEIPVSSDQSQSSK